MFDACLGAGETPHNYSTYNQSHYHDASETGGETMGVL